MNKKSIILSLLMSLVIFFVSAQKKYEIAFEKDMCNCISQEQPKGKRTLNSNFDFCFKKYLVKYASTIEAQTTGTHYEKLRQGARLKQELLERFKSSMVHSCDFYYQLIAQKRDIDYINLSDTASEKKLEELNQNVALSPNQYNLLARGNEHFAHGNFQKALKDFNETLKINGMFLQAHIMIAWTYERLNDYVKAINSYNQIFEKSGIWHKDLAVLRELAKRKNGKPYTSQTINTLISTTKRQEAKKEKNRKTRRRGNVNRAVTNTEKKKEKKKDTSSLRKLFKIDN